ncbi:MAG: VOC family protein [Anaerolineae bacterium]|nr:VOC family protein [Anaerolineae bacterium]
MNISALYPVIGTDKVAESKAFYTAHFPFEVTFEADWYVSLITREEPHFQLALLDYRHPSVPAAFRRPSQGLLLNFEVAEVDPVYARLKAAGLPIHLELKSEAWGQRHFITADPNGLLIDIIQLIPPSPEFAAQYSPSALEELGG